MKGKLMAALGLALLLALALLPGAPAESEQTYTSGPWKYTLEDGGAVITTGPGDAELIMPSMLDGHTVIAIGKYAFRKRDGLKSVVIPEGVTRVDLSAFMDCAALESVTLPGSLTSIGEGAFRDCAALESVALPGSLTSIGESAFRDCAALESVTLPGSLTTLGAYAFLDCISLWTMRTGDGLTAIPEGAFHGCESLRRVSIGSRVQRIDSNAFYACVNLENLFIPNSVTEIVENAFEGHGEGLTFWGEKDSAAHAIALAQGIDFCDVYDDWLKWKPAADGECTVTGHGPEMDISIAIPDTLDGLRVTKIGDDAFRDCAGLRGVVIPLGVTEIGYCAFKGCGDLTGLALRGGVQTIGVSAFDRCTGLTRVALPMGVETIGESAFRNCANLKRVDLPSSLLSIGRLAFKGCAALAEIDIPEGVEALGVSAFQNCAGLTRASIPGSVVEIGKCAFFNCAAMTDVDIGEGVAVIGISAFEGCKTLKRIDLPEGVTTIGGGAFRYCAALAAAAVPASVTRIGGGAFYSTGLEDLYYGSTAAMWARVELGGDAIPSGCAVHTLPTVDARLTLTGLTAADAVTLTDGSGTVFEATESGTYPLWAEDAWINVAPGAGRRYQIAILHDGASQSAARTDTGAISLPLDLELGAADVTLAFESDEEATTCILHVSERRLGALDGEPAWTVSDGTAAFGDGDQLVASSGGIMPMKTFTLTITPNGWGCAGTLVQNGRVLGMVTPDALSCAFTPEADVALTLVWYDPGAYRALRYDGNGSSGSMGAQLTQADGDGAWKATVAQSLFDGNVSGSYNLFAGWNTAADGTGDDYAPGDEIALAADTTLYARWTPAWRVAFDANGGTGIMTPVLADRTASDVTVTLPACGYARAGMAFAGWSTRKNGNGDAYAPGDVVTLTKNMTLYAQWTDAWTVTFDPNGGDGAAFARGVARGAALVLPNGGGFSREGHDFAGWNTDPDGNGDAWDAGAEFTPSADATFYAQWTQTLYDIHCTYCEAYDADGNAVTRAAEGALVWLDVVDDPNLSNDVYFTFAFASDDVGIDAEGRFTMPDGPVSVAAVTAPRTRPVIDLTAQDSATLPYEVAWALPDVYAAEGYEYGDPLEIDLNGDGAADVYLELAVDYEDPCTLTRLAGADALEGPVTVPLFTGEGEAHFMAYSGCVISVARTPAFGEPDCVLPADLKAIGESAFEGDAAIGIVEIPYGCLSIGAYAFKDCAGLTQIRIPYSVADIADTAFDGCGTVWVFAPTGSAAQEFCRESGNCRFVAEDGIVMEGIE